jgi:nitrogen regulatory protein PII
LKQVVAIIKPFVAEKVIKSMADFDIHEIIVREAKGYGRQKNYLQQYDESEYSLAFLPKVELLIWVDDDLVDLVVQKIVSVARTGRIGDGKILVLPAFDVTECSDSKSGRPRVS